MSAGENKTFDLVFPADYHGKEVAGRRAVFELTMKSAAEPILPELDAEFARNFGIASGTVAELRAEITANLQLELKRRVEGSLKEQVMQALHTTTDFVVPRSLVEQETQRLLERSIAELKNRGVEPGRTQLTADTFRPTAQRLVSSGLIINEVVRQHQLQPSPEQVRALVEETAQSYEQPEAVVRWHYEQPERLNEYEMMAVERNVIEWALKQAQVVDSPTTFAALMEPAANR
jgi:trigger factor